MKLRLTPRDVRVPGACILVRLKKIFQGGGRQISPPVTITTQYFSRSFVCLHSIYILYPYPPSLEKCIRYLSHDTLSEPHKSTSRRRGTPLVGFPACTAPGAHSRRNVQRRGYLYKDLSDPSDPSISLTSPLTRRPPLFTPCIPTSGVLSYTNVKHLSSGYQSTPPPPPFFLALGY